MPDVKLETEKPLDLLDDKSPKLSSIDDMPVIETKPDVVVEAAPAEEAVIEESATSDQPEVPAATTAPKKAQGVQKRIDELTRQREDERRRADAENAEKLRLLAMLEARDKPAPKKAEESAPVKPIRTEFPDPDAYDNAMDAYYEQRAEYVAQRKYDQLVAEQHKKESERRVEEQRQEVQKSYNERVTKTREKYADFTEVAESPDVNISIPMAEAIFYSEQGPEIQYYLGKNSAEAKRISAMTMTVYNPEVGQMVVVSDARRQLLELGVIAANLRTPQPVVTKPVSSAPAPGKPIRTASEPDKDLQDLSMDEYAQKVREREAARRKPGARLYS